ncbi:CHAT domain-containing protein [Bradyrhizobium brasilense]|uniref:CHAT domain-containing protein n=1 Tax=Bradyrhizobium brasilense TaxID=1419277 RepID=UPI002877EACF|nr:CHAT domain-containing protein [Bradyrhizobium brasilense]MCP3414234.1 CHAT domain-containing protein [Bradyrhizobium brasilense]
MLPREPSALGRLSYLIVAIILCSAPALGAVELPKIDPAEARDVNIGRLDEVPVELPDRQITHLLVSSEGNKLWIGTTDGVAEYDGVRARPPRFEADEQATALYVNSMAEIEPGRVLLGTINDTIWLWEGGRIRRIHDGDSRDEWSTARLADGRVVIAHNFWRPADRALAEVREALPSKKVVLLPDAVNHLAAVPNGVIGATSSGRITLYEGQELKPKSNVDLHFTNMQFVNSIVYDGSDRVLVASTAGCFSIDVEAKSSSRLSDAPCGAVASASDGAVWAASKGLFLGAANGWQRAIAEKDAESDITALAQDRSGNVWIGTRNDLYRASSLSRQAVGLPNKTVVSMAYFKGVLATAFDDGALWTVDSDLRSTEVTLPHGAAGATPGYGGTAVTFDRNGILWALNNAGLLKVQANIVSKTADCPVCDAGRVPASIAVSSNGEVFAGFYGSNDLWTLINGSWKTAATLSEDKARSVNSVFPGGEGEVWASGVSDLARVDKGSARMLGPFDGSKTGKLHLYGALTSHGSMMVAAGGWGGTVFAPSGSANDPPLVENKGGTDQPYVIRGLASHPKLGLLAATQTGIYVWSGTPSAGSWRSLRELDANLGRPATAIVAGDGGQFWVGTSRGPVRFSIPDVDDGIRISRRESGPVIHSRDVHFSFEQNGLARCCTIKLDVQPHVTGLSEDHRTPASVVMTGLADDTSYVVTAALVDFFGRTGKVASDRFAISLSVWDSPLKLSASILAALLVIILLVSQRGPAGFILRRIARKRWSLEAGPADLQLAIEDTPSGVRFSLSSPSDRSTITASAAKGRETIVRIQSAQLADIFRQNRASQQDARDRFLRKLDAVSRVLWNEVLPTDVTFAMSQRPGGSLTLEVPDAFLNMLWEASADHKGRSLSSRFSCGRTVRSTRLASKSALPSEELKVVVFAPVDDLTQTETEIQAVERRARAWGASVRVMKDTSPKSEVLDAIRSCHIFHYAGHARYAHDDPSASYLPILNDKVTAAEIGAALSETDNQLLLAFINGCSSSREAEWKGGEAVFGLASAFLSNSTYFVGAQWPVLDAHAATLADDFYRLLFPRTDILLWRLFRRKALSGIAVAEALRQARGGLEGRGVELQTRQAYVFYGDPTATITLS